MGALFYRQSLLHLKIRMKSLGKRVRYSHEAIPESVVGLGCSHRNVQVSSIRCSFAGNTRMLVLVVTLPGAPRRHQYYFDCNLR